MNRIDINEKVLSKNDIVAARLREVFARTHTAVINLASSPGSGKTSLLEALLPQLKVKYKLAVIEGDLRTENDADRLRQLGINAIQIQTGDACHLEALQIEALLDNIDINSLDLLIIENIGNLVCPASYDLGEDAFFVMLSVTEGDDKPAKYPTIFFNADYFILNKIDLVPYVDFSIEKCMANALAVNARLKTATVSARTGEGLDGIVKIIEGIIEKKQASPNSQNINENKKVLYYAQHIAGVSSMIALRCQFHPNEEAILIGSSKSKIASTGIFDKVVSCDKIYFELRKLATIEEQEQLILSTYDKVFADAGIDLTDFVAIYISCDIMNILGVYLSLKQCEFNMVEIALLQFENRGRYNVDTNQGVRLIQEKYDVLCGLNNQYVRQRLRFSNVHEAAKDEYVDFMALFFSIPQAGKKALNDCFGIDVEPLRSPNSCLVLPNSTTFGGVGGNQRILLYTTLMDYYAKNYICYIKEHPNTQKDMKLDKHIDAMFLDAATPFEFYMLKDDFTINRSISIDSSMSDKLANRTKENIKLGHSFFRYFTFCHKLYCAFELIKPNTCYIYGLDIDFVSKFAYYCFKYEASIKKLAKQDNIQMAIVNSLPEALWRDLNERLADNAVIVFLQEEHYLLSEFAQYVLPICISKKATGKCADDLLETEIFYIFCKSAEIREQMRYFSLSKNLKYTQISITAEAKQLKELTTIARSSRGLKQKLLGLIPSKKNRYKTRNIYPKWLIYLLCCFVPSRERRCVIRQHYIRKDK